MGLKKKGVNQGHVLKVQFRCERMKKSRKLPMYLHHRCIEGPSNIALTCATQQYRL